MPTWGDDNLSKFLDVVHSNQKANFVNFGEPYAVLLRINDSFYKLGKHLGNARPVMVATLCLRCQYAYKGAAGLALSGQVVEAFALIRSTLEYAGYGLMIFRDPPLETAFINRHQTDADMRAHKQTFNVGKVKSTIASYDSNLAALFNTFYKLAIDFGAHPNPHGTFSAIKMENVPEGTAITTLALSNDPHAIAHALKSVGQAGLTALFIFQHVFKEKFELLGIRAELDALRRVGGL
jgi:hypothetical protein